MVSNRFKRVPVWLKPARYTPRPLRRMALEQAVNRSLQRARDLNQLAPLRGHVISIRLYDVGLLWSGIVQGDRVRLLAPERAPNHIETDLSTWMTLLLDPQPETEYRQRLIDYLAISGTPTIVKAIKQFLLQIDAGTQPPLWQHSVQNLQQQLSQPLGLRALSHALERAISGLYQQYPAAVDRLQPIYGKHFYIRIDESPWDISLRLFPRRVQLTCLPRKPDRLPSYDVYVAGPLRTLLDIVEGEQDGDAQFFSRTLKVQGDMDILVMLRNVLDNEDIVLRDALGHLLGPAGKPVLWIGDHLAKSLGAAS